MARSRTVFVDTRYAYVAGGVTGVLLLATVWAVGSISGAEALALLEGTLPTIRFLCSTTATAAATILALMLTTLSLSESHSGEFKEEHFRRIRQIGVLTIVTLITSVFLLMILAVPLGESEEIPATAFTVLYYVILGFSALVGGLLVMVSLMLFQAIQGLIALFQPGTESPIVERRKEEQEAVAG